MTLYVEERGDGGDLMVLLHGMGATAAAWRRATVELAGGWSGRIAAYDLPGHGRSPRLAAYTYDAVAEAIAGAIPAHDRLVVVGHSFGGAIAVVLASGGYGVNPLAVVATSVKVVWSAEEVAGAAAQAARPARWFERRDEAEERYRKVSGLAVAIAPDAADIDRGVEASAEGWRLSADPGAFTVGAPDMAGAIAACRCPVLLCRGAADTMVSTSELLALAVATVDLADAGHNVHVEKPVEFARCTLEFVTAALAS